jgi:curved DNA-binding protein CbpA
MAPPDYYRALDVDRGASSAAIKAAFRALAKKLHPDLNAHDHTSEAAFKALNEAYTVLSDPLERQKYDAANRWAGQKEVSGGAGGFRAAPRGDAVESGAWAFFLREETARERAAQRLREAAQRGGGGPFAGGGSSVGADRHEGWEARRAARVAAAEAAEAASTAARGASETGYYRAYAGQWRARQGSGGGLWPALVILAVVTTVAVQSTGFLSSLGSKRRQ